ncbi:Ni/Fe hydrogenase subunit alpha [Pseudothauera hydrothermalis]|uniref:Ni/Fe hydrogenase subunit alpha n=1 Tax=Pseudothauera hydrothermalis TaxID=2184083 RepID=UPI000E095292|nr:Ni/Fe hydrogenase subunit alpha [Pseudothauera hydrothermalis]
MAFELETADGRDRLRRVAIDPVSRVEGHGKVTLLIDEHDEVREARLHIVEFRGFEVFIQGRPYWEVPVMVQRLCGICPVSHHLAAAKALDVATAAAPITASAEKLRRLMHYGQILQSHALHFFHLSSPDLLFGFESEVARRNIVGVAAAYPDIARQGVLLRKFGQEVIRATAGKKIHGTGAVPGGMNRHLSAEDHALLARDIDRVIDWSRAAVELVKRLYRADPALYDVFGSFESAFMSLVRADGAMDLYDGGLRVRDAQGHILRDHVPDQDYHRLICEEVKPWSYMKFPFLRELGPETGWYRVGPLARVQNCDFIPTPHAEAERREFIDHGQGRPVHATLAYHWARMIEMLHAAEVIRALLADPDLRSGELLRPGTGAREGVGIIEAPRGTLIHHYRIGEDDLVTMCNLIVSTTHNNQAMNTAVREVAKRYLSGRTLTEGLLNHIEVAIRAYDPCLSCATHALGQMPLVVELVCTDGTVHQRLVRKR